MGDPLFVHYTFAGRELIGKIKKIKKYACVGNVQKTTFSNFHRLHVQISRFSTVLSFHVNPCKDREIETDPLPVEGTVDGYLPDGQVNLWGLLLPFYSRLFFQKVADDQGELKEKAIEAIKYRLYMDNYLDLEDTVEAAVKKSK